MKPNNTLLAMTACAAISTAQFLSIITSRSASPIHLQTLNANHEGLWLGKPQSDCCPIIQGLPCPNTTGFTTTYGLDENSGQLGLAVSVPGGQQIYIDPVCGKISYTLPHSVNVPSGAITQGWSNDELAWFGELSWKLPGVGSGVLFCSASNDSSVGPWQAFAALDGLSFGKGCLGASLITSNVTHAGGYQYI